VAALKVIDVYMKGKKGVTHRDAIAAMRMRTGF
jgi:hypothetical protein